MFSVSHGAYKCDKNELVLGAWAWHMARIYYKEDHPSDGKTTWTILEGHDLEEDSTRQANVETTC